jgi:hypothetical protein
MPVGVADDVAARYLVGEHPLRAAIMGRPIMRRQADQVSRPTRYEALRTWTEH